jgi:hypothetical protein
VKGTTSASEGIYPALLGTSTTGKGMASVFKPALSDPEGNEGESKGANKVRINGRFQPLRALDAAPRERRRSNRGRAALQGRVRASSEERGFSPCETGSRLNLPAADEYGYSSALATNRARTGLNQMYSRCF